MWSSYRRHRHRGRHVRVHKAKAMRDMMARCGSIWYVTISAYDKVVRLAATKVVAFGPLVGMAW